MICRVSCRHWNHTTRWFTQEIISDERSWSAECHVDTEITSHADLRYIYDERSWFAWCHVETEITNITHRLTLHLWRDIGSCSHVETQITSHADLRYIYDEINTVICLVLYRDRNHFTRRLTLYLWREIMIWRDWTHSHHALIYAISMMRDCEL